MFVPFVMLFLMVIPSAARPEDTDWATYYEKSGYRATPRYAETVEYCRRLARASTWLSYASFGVSPQGRALPLLIADKHGGFDPRSARRRDKVVLLIQAGIHSGEIDGKDAGLMLLRDLALFRKRPEVLEHVTILFIPIFNVDGHERFSPYNRINQNGPEEMGWRTTAQNLNLNRDYLKADTPEMQAWLRLFTDWLPDFFVDCHVTDGSDYQYVVTYGLEIYGNMAPSLDHWTRHVYLRSIEEGMTAAGFPLSPYVMLRNPPDPKSGIVSWVATPRFSEGYTAVQNRPGLLIETHMLKDYRTRVDGTYEMLGQTVELLNREYKSLRTAVKEADRATESEEFRRAPFPVQFRADSQSVTIDFLGVEYSTVKSDITGDTWYQFGARPEVFKVPFFNRQNPVVSVELPEAYILPPEWVDVIGRLELHGIRLTRLEKAASLPVKSYRFENVRWQERPFEGRHPVRFEAISIEEERAFPAGSVVIDMNQRAARVAAHVLEPDAPDSYVSWGFFDAIFEQKEYAEPYVMEKIARDMMRDDPAIGKDFERKKAEDPEFAKNPRAMLNWFYSKTPYWDTEIGRYPVGRVFDRSALDSLPLADRKPMTSEPKGR